MEETNDFEDSVKKELELAGFKVDAQVGVGSFRLDLAVRNPNGDGTYAIAIECDGATYHSSQSARDRDILRQEILQGMGWKIYRIWSTEWFRNRDESVKMLIANVNKAIGKEYVKNVDPDKAVPNEGGYEENLVSVPARHGNAGTPYKKSEVRCTREMVMNPSKKYPFVHALTSIVRDEGPIHLDLLMARVKDLADVSRAGANIQNNFDEALKYAIKEGYIEKIKNDKGFIYEVGKNYSSFRLPGDGVQRRLNEISAVELKNAIIYLIQEQFGLAYDNLVQSVKMLFSVPRVDPEESDRIKDIVDEMIMKGQLVKHGPLVNLAVRN